MNGITYKVCFRVYGYKICLNSVNSRYNCSNVTAALTRGSYKCAALKVCVKRKVPLITILVLIIYRGKYEN